MYIERKRARFEFERFFKGKTDVQGDCDSLLCTLPAADVAPVVRCKDCRKLRGNGTCNITEMVCKADDFCSYGERKETNDL